MGAHSSKYSFLTITDRRKQSTMSNLYDRPLSPIIYYNSTAKEKVQQLSSKAKEKMSWFRIKKEKVPQGILFSFSIRPFSSVTHSYRMTTQHVTLYNDALCRIRLTSDGCSLLAVYLGCTAVPAQNISITCGVYVLIYITLSQDEHNSFL